MLGYSRTRFLLHLKCTEYTWIEKGKTRESIFLIHRLFLDSRIQFVKQASVFHQMFRVVYISKEKKRKEKKRKEKKERAKQDFISNRVSYMYTTISFFAEASENNKYILCMYSPCKNKYTSEIILRSEWGWEICIVYIQNIIYILSYFIEAIEKDRYIWLQRIINK